MKIKNITDTNKFFEMIQKCEGTVELVTNQGDRLNLKSKLSQYIALANVFSEAKIDDIELVLHEPKDVNMLLEYLIMG